MKRAGRAPHLIECPPDRPHGGLVEPGADVSHPAQSQPIPLPENQRAEARGAAPFTVREPTDQCPGRVLEVDLPPVDRPATGPVEALRSFGDHPLEGELEYR